MNPYGLADALRDVQTVRDRAEGAAIVTVVADRSTYHVSPGRRLFVPDRGEPRGTIHTLLDALLVEDARAALSQRRSTLISYRVEKERPERVGVQRGDIDIFFEVLARAPVLVIVGAGHIAVPLAQLARILEFRVVVLDDRPEFACRERFPGADEILLGPYRETLAGIDVDPDTYIVLVTRGHVHDQACLEQVIHSPAAYIGMIGSKRRVRTVMSHTAERGFPGAALQKVHAPVGLNIGAQTPAEIALSIMAEIVSVRRGGDAPSLARHEFPRV